MEKQLVQQQQPLPHKAKVEGFEFIWKYSFFLSAVVFAALMDRVYRYRGDPTNTHVYGNAYNLLWSVPIMLLFHLSKRYIDRKLSKKIEGMLCDRRFPSEEKKEERSHLLSKWVFDVFYYSFTTVTFLIMQIIGVYIMHDHSSFPDYLNGSFACRNIMDRSLLASHQRVIEYFYVLQFSNHCYSLISHVATANMYGKSKFYEYCLHHGMAFFLIFYSYMLSYWIIGTMVLILHDVSDVFLIIGRFYMVMRLVIQDLKNKNKGFLSILYVLTFIVWVFTRLAVFPACCLSPAFSKDNTTVEYFLFGMLFGLLVMHVYWTYFFIRSVTFNKRRGEY